MKGESTLPDLLKLESQLRYI